MTRFLKLQVVRFCSGLMQSLNNVQLGGIYLYSPRLLSNHTRVGVCLKAPFRVFRLCMRVPVSFLFRLLKSCQLLVRMAMLSCPAMLSVSPSHRLSAGGALSRRGPEPGLSQPGRLVCRQCQKPVCCSSCRTVTPVGPVGQPQVEPTLVFARMTVRTTVIHFILPLKTFITMAMEKAMKNVSTSHPVPH